MAHFMYDLVHFFAVYLPYCSQCYLVSMPGHKLFPREINYFPISIWKWSFHTEISFAHLQYSLKVRNWEKTWTQDGQFSSLVRFKTTSLNWISLVMKIDHPSFTFFSRSRPFRILLRRKQNTHCRPTPQSSRLYISACLLNMYSRQIDLSCGYRFSIDIQMLLKFVWYALVQTEEGNERMTCNIVYKYLWSRSAF